ncbi:hypothetical protein JW698_00740 [Candidatus Wolfebacteria bacterium]|nr:hypothetical protein [Candidatus Wolfebacteria bacterium]
MSKLNKILLVVVIVLLIALAGVFYWQKEGFQKSYWAVYLNTGDFYFGKISRFPKLSLTDVWFLQRNVQDEENPLSLARFDQVFWTPENKVYLNNENVIWKAKLKKDSDIVNFFKNPSALQGQQAQQIEGSQLPIGNEIENN